MKKKKRTLYKTNNSTDLEYNRIIKIAIGVLLVLGIVYFVTAYASGEIKFGNKKKAEVVKEETTIQYKEIIVGELLNRNYKEYYVLFYNPKDTYANYYISNVDTYNGKEKKKPFFVVDTTNVLNESYIISDEDEDKTINTSSIENLRVTSPIILRIKDKKIVETIEGRDNILKFFDSK